MRVHSRFCEFYLKLLHVWHWLELFLKIFTNDVSKLLVELVTIQLLRLEHLRIEGDILIDVNKRLDWALHSCLLWRWPSPIVEGSHLYDGACVIWIIMESMQILFLLGLRLVILIKATLDCKAVICKQIVAAVIYDFLIEPVTEFHNLVLSIHR